MSVLDSPPSLDATTSRGGGTPRLGFFSSEWCLGPQIALGGSDYWRLGLPAAKLYENNWDVIFARNLAESPSGRIAVQSPQGNWYEDRDIVIIQRWMGEGTAKRIRRAREAGQIVINEIDDHYWQFPEGHVSIRNTDPEHNKAANREHYRESIQASSFITVSTSYLADELADWGPPVRMVRNYIDFTWWADLTPPGDYIGWVGGIPWRGRDLEILRETVTPWLRERQRFFYHGGAVADAPIEDRLDYDRVTTRPLCGLPDYPKLWEPLRVALIPIADTPFGRGKSWIKGLEAAARGVPFIHSQHAEYEELGMGLCVQEPEDWVRHLEALEDPVFYEEQRMNNRKRAEELSIELHWQSWADVFLEAAVVT